MNKLTISEVTIDDPRFEQFLRIAGNAHISSRLTDPDRRFEYREALRREGPAPETAFYVAEANGNVVGGFRLLDFIMRIRGTECRAGGLGLLSVDLPYKNLGIAREMVLYYLSHYRARGATLGLLHPFRPDFYRTLGFGYGRKVDTYRIAPRSLPRDDVPRTYRMLGADDSTDLIACYDRMWSRSNGLLRKHPAIVAEQLRDPHLRTVGFERDRKLAGYATFLMQQARPHNAMSNELIVNELIYDDPDAFRGLLEFLRRQADQFAVVVIRNLPDGFHFVPDDPRNDNRDGLHRPAWHETNVQAVGIMYRVLRLREVFETLEAGYFGLGQCTIQFDVTDSLLTDNTGSVTVRFEEGRVHLLDERPDVTLSMRVGELASILSGAVALKPLVEFGVVGISDISKLTLANHILLSESPPLCTTRF